LRERDAPATAGQAPAIRELMEFTWITIIASLCMGIGAALVFMYAAKKNYFHNIEDTKYQVFWSDFEEFRDSRQEEQKDVEEKGQQ
jgi:hypothetical protein